MRDSTERLLTEQLGRNQHTLATLQRNDRQQLVLTATLLAESPSLRSAIATYRVERQSGQGDRADLAQTVERELVRLGSDLEGGALLATDERGRVFAGYARGVAAPPRGLDLSRLSSVRNALDPDVVSSRNEPYLSGLELGDTYFSVGAAPVILDGFTIGTIVFGQALDSAMVARIRGAFEGEVVVSAGTRIVSSTLPHALAPLAIADPGQTGRALTLGGEEYLVAALPIGSTQRGSPLRITLLQPLGPAVRALTRTLLRDFLLFGTLAVLLAGLASALLSRSLLDPLTRFIQYLRAGAPRATTTEPLAFRAEDSSEEIRALDSSFGQLMTSLDGQRAELERRSEALVAANEVLTDEIRGRERAGEALRESEAQLRQSQKLEAIGNLAGGIAHDFNNMLTVISGFTQLAIGQLGPSHKVTGDLRQVTDAARSAASLTQQLLAFSRKQVLKPRVLDLAAAVHGMEGMLRRLIGSHIELQVGTTDEQVHIKADPSQVEQVILNLAVNARDAMPGGGTLRIGVEARPEGVALCVTDTGIGMTPAIRDRVFEPFFTTKETGRGTGLGLSTVYGIMTQSGGTIGVESEPGQGSSFCAIFPAAAEPLSAPYVDDEDAPPPRGTETVLLVDDEDQVRAMATRALEGCGYTVLSARTGVEALALARGAGPIHLLLTDVVMPQLSGPQLVERFVEKYPSPTVIYMTGQMDDTVMRLELDEEVYLLRKPFTPAGLARAARAALDARHPTVSASPHG